MTATASSHVADNAARLLALMVAVDGTIGRRELEALAAVGAFERIGTARPRFEELARESIAGIGPGPYEKSWLTETELAYVDRLLDAVSDPGARHLLCRLAAAVLARGGADREPAVFDHALARWHVSGSDVAPARR